LVSERYLSLFQAASSRNECEWVLLIVNVSRCWEAFAKIHEEIRTPEILYALTCRVIEDFYRDRVIYLELRTTPKKIHEIRSKDIYIKSVVKAIMYVFLRVIKRLTYFPYYLVYLWTVVEVIC